MAVIVSLRQIVEELEALPDEAIRGRGAFRTFKDAVHRRGTQGDWYGFRDAAIADIVAAWLDEHGVAYVRDLDLP